MKIYKLILFGLLFYFTLTFGIISYFDFFNSPSIIKGLCAIGLTILISWFLYKFDRDKNEREQNNRN